MKEIKIAERIWVEGQFRSAFREGAAGVSWLRKRDHGVEVQFDGGALYMFPWGQISMVAYQ